MLVHLLGRELLEAVRVLGLRGPRVGLLEARGELGGELRALGVDARGRGVEASGDALDAAGFHHVEGDHDVVVEDDGVVGLDEPHAAHVRGEVEAVIAALEHLLAVLEQAEIREDELVAEHLLLGKERGRGGAGEGAQRGSGFGGGEDRARGTPPMLYRFILPRGAEKA